MKNSESGLTVGDDEWAAAVDSAANQIHTEEAASRSRSWKRSQQATYLVLLGIVVSVVVALRTPKMLGPGPVTLSASEQASDLRAEAALLIEQIEAVKAETGALPSPDVLTPFLDEGYEYDIVNASTGRYVVRRTAGGVTVTYDGTLSLGLWLLLGS